MAQSKPLPARNRLCHTICWSKMSDSPYGGIHVRKATLYRDPKRRNLSKRRTRAAGCGAHRQWGRVRGRMTRFEACGDCGTGDGDRNGVVSLVEAKNTCP
eukprot:1501919-Rhodomonas_salina.1